MDMLFGTETSELAVLQVQMQQVQDEKAQLSRVSAELVNTTDEISRCVFLQQQRNLRRLRQELARKQMHLVLKYTAEAKLEEQMETVRAKKNVWRICRWRSNLCWTGKLQSIRCWHVTDGPEKRSG